MKYYLILFSLCLFSLSGNAQKFQGTYGTNSEDSFNAIVELPDGDFLIAGHSSGFSGGADDFILYKISSTGEFITHKAFGSLNSETIEELVLLDNGDIAFLGYSNSYTPTGDLNLFYGVMSADLDIIWSKLTTSTGSETAKDLIETSDQHLLIVGAGDGYGDDGSKDLFMIKSTIEGELVWAKALGLTDHEAPSSCTEDNEGNIYVYGHCSSEFTQQYDLLLVQLNQNGDVNWSKTFAGINNEIAYSSIPHPHEGILICGATNSFGAGLKDSFVMHIDSEGEVLWNNTYGTNLNDYGTAMDRHENESFIVGGVTGGFGGGGLDMFSMLIDLQGVLKFGQAYGGPIKETCYDALSCSDGGAAFVGYSRSYGEGFNSGFITKLDVHGTSGCAQEYATNIETHAIEFNETIVDLELKTEIIDVVPFELNEVVTAYVHSALVCEVNYITEEQASQQSQESLDQFEEELPALEEVDFESKLALYPNPTQGNAWLEISTDKDDWLDLAIIDMNGRSLWSQEFQIERDWVHKLNVPVQDLESGVYFLKIETSENQTLKRLIIE